MFRGRELKLRFSEVVWKCDNWSAVTTLWTKRIELSKEVYFDGKYWNEAQHLRDEISNISNGILNSFLVKLFLENLILKIIA